MSIVTYNGITLPLGNITQFNQESVYDDSGTDRIYTKFTISVQTILSSNYLAVIDPMLINLDSAQFLPYLRQQLLQQRRGLSVKFNGNELIPQIQPGNKGMVDAKNGPIPKHCNIIQLTTDTYLLDFSIEAHYWDNLDLLDHQELKNNPGANIVYNRWTEMVDINALQYTTRVRNGKFRIRSDNVAGTVADSFRNSMCILGIPAGFLRKKQKYTMSGDGLEISYEITDEEIYKKPISPAYKAKGTYRESVPKQAPFRIMEAQVHLEGSKDTSQSDLINAAIKNACNILFTRGVQLRQGFQQKITILMGAELVVGLYDNVVDFVVSVMASKPTGNVRVNNIAAFNIKVTTAQADTNRNYLPAYFNRGTGGLLLDAAKYYDPTLTTNSIELENVVGININPNANNTGDNALGGANWADGLDIGQAGRDRET